MDDSSKIAAYLLKEAKVAVNDGKNYGPGGERHLRIVLGVYREDQSVYDCLYRIRDGLRSYRENH